VTHSHHHHHNKETADGSWFNELIHGPQPVLIRFGADWCEPCKWLDPILEELKHQLEEKVLIHKIDVDRHHELASEYQVRSVPTLFLFKGGQIKWRYQGFDTPSAMKNMILEHL
jgi:thioredoxin 1